MNKIITRFAPSPTGNLHIGGIRTALINYIYTRQSKDVLNSKFLLRIEDTDKNRSKEEYNVNILKGLRWLGIDWDAEPVIQSKRILRHKEIAFDLLNLGSAFKCICTKEILEIQRTKNREIRSKKICLNCENNTSIQNSEENYCVRVKIPQGKTKINDMIQGEIEINNIEIDDFILLRNDGTPTYMLSVIVDDHDMDVNTVIRGDDHLNNCFRQIQVYNHLKWPIPKYAHIPLIHGQDGSKLSKRHGAIDINDFKNNGYLPESIINSLILLGWSPKKNEEFIELSEIIEIFDINKLSKSSSIFDYKKLNYFNNHYLKKEKNFYYFLDFIKNNTQINKYFESDNDKMKRIFEIYKKNINHLKELIEISKTYYDNIKLINKEILNEDFDIILNEFKIEIDKIIEWNSENIESVLKKFIKAKDIKFPFFGKPFRYILINSEIGPSIGDILYILGKKNTLFKINNYISNSG